MVLLKESCWRFSRKLFCWIINFVRIHFKATYESSSSETVVKPSSPLQASATLTTTLPAPPQRTFMPLRDPEPIVLTSQATEKETSHYQVPSLNLNDSATKENASEDAGLVSSTTSSTQPTVAKESSETTIGVTVSPVTISNSPTIQTLTTVSTMTPPMSPPQTDQLLLSRATNVSIFNPLESFYSILSEWSWTGVL